MNETFNSLLVVQLGQLRVAVEVGFVLFGKLTLDQKVILLVITQMLGFTLVVGTTKKSSFVVSIFNSLSS